MAFSSYAKSSKSQFFQNWEHPRNFNITVQQDYAALCTVLFVSFAGNISIPIMLGRRQKIKYLWAKRCVLHYEYNSRSQSVWLLLSKEAGE